MMNPTRSGVYNFRTSASSVDRVFTSMKDSVSLTRQDQAMACNINNIYRKTQQGQLSMLASKAPTFGDFSDVGTYDVVLEAINAAQEAFNSLPSDIRKLYNNDPEVYYEKVTEGAVRDLREQAEADARAAKKIADDKAFAEAQALVSSRQSSNE